MAGKPKDKGKAGRTPSQVEMGDGLVVTKTSIPPEAGSIGTISERLVADALAEKEERETKLPFREILDTYKKEIDDGVFYKRRKPKPFQEARDKRLRERRVESKTEHWCRPVDWYWKSY